MNAESTASLIRSFSGRRVLVVGDLMLDEFVHGDVARISPEAPVPILEVRGRQSCPGGAANAAANVVSLGGVARLLGIVGDDAAGASLRSLAAEGGLDARGVLVDPGRETTHKTRIVARGQQVVRIDQESKRALGPEQTQKLGDLAKAGLEKEHACVLSDYGKGVLSTELLGSLLDAAKAEKVPVVVDPKRRDFAAYRGATVLTPNLSELEMASGAPCASEADIVKAAEGLLDSLQGAAILVTRGAAGMTLVQPGRPVAHTHARAREVFDVTGAGDTVVGTLALALGTGMALEDAIEVASVAAGLAVSKMGTATVRVQEILSELEPRGSKAS